MKDNKDDFGQKAVTKAEDLLSMFGSRSMPLFMVFNLGKMIKYHLESNFEKYFVTDIQEEFSIQSLRFQSNDQSSMAYFACIFLRKETIFNNFFLISSYWTIWLKGSFTSMCGSRGYTKRRTKNSIFSTSNVHYNDTLDCSLFVCMC